MPVVLLALGVGVLWWLGRQQAVQPPAAPAQVAGSGWEPPLLPGPGYAEISGYWPPQLAYGIPYGYEAVGLTPQPLPNGQSDSGLASAAVLEALGAAANVATILMLTAGTSYHAGGFGPHHVGAFGWGPPPLPPQVQGVVEWAKTAASSDQIASILNRYPHPGVRAALASRFHQLRSVGL